MPPPTARLRCRLVKTAYWHRDENSTLPMKSSEFIWNVSMSRIHSMADTFLDLPLGSRCEVIAYTVFLQKIQAFPGVEVPSMQE